MKSGLLSRLVTAASIFDLCAFNYIASVVIPAVVGEAPPSQDRSPYKRTLSGRELLERRRGNTYINVPFRTSGCLNDVRKDMIERGPSSISECSIFCSDILLLSTPFPHIPLGWSHCPVNQVYSFATADPGEPEYSGNVGPVKFQNPKLDNEEMGWMTMTMMSENTTNPEPSILTSVAFPAPILGTNLQMSGRVSKRRRALAKASLTDKGATFFSSEKESVDLTSALETEENQFFPLFTVAALPATGSAGTVGEFSPGSTAIKYQVRVTRNDCLSRRAWAHLEQTNLADPVTLYENLLWLKEQNLTVGNILPGLECDFSVHVNDIRPPRFTFCPPDRTMVLPPGQQSIRLFYDYPTARDTIDSTVEIELIKGLHSGAELKVGRYPFVFVATDTSGNAAYCAFRIKVVPSPDDRNAARWAGSRELPLDENGRPTIPRSSWGPLGGDGT